MQDLIHNEDIRFILQYINISHSRQPSVRKLLDNLKSSYAEVEINEKTIKFQKINGKWCIINPIIIR